MLLEFFKNSDKHNVAEIRGVKALMSSRESYVENAVGYVEVKRTGILCDVRAKVVPEHKVSLKHYMVTVQIEEKDDTILDASCDGCAAAAGGCKHTLVLLYWLQTRSSEPSPTSIQCYWQKQKSKQSYIKNKIVSNKCMGQIQLEMLATQKSKCIFCVADPNFEQNQRIEKVIVDFDEVYIKNMMDEAEKYWKTYIYPRILKSAL